MIETRQNVVYGAVLIGPEGLTTVGVKTEDRDGNTIHARMTDNIVETEPGVYLKNDMPVFIDPGFYLAIWDTGGVEPEFTVEEVVVYSAVIQEGIIPSIDRVAVLIRARTKVRGSGEEIGTFTNDEPVTRPTRWQAVEAIDEAAKEVIGQVGFVPDSLDPTNPSALRDATSSVIALLSAMTIESSFFPEQVETGRSNYAALERRYKDAIKRLMNAVGQAGGSTAGEDQMGAGDYLRPSYGFGDDGLGTTLTEPF
jgi:hypothetical protein